MIIEFFVKNFASFKEEQVLSFVASNYDKSHPENYIDLDLPGMKGIKLLKGLAIYGANAAGKSNVISALAVFQLLVSRSFVWGSEHSGLDPFYMPFALDDQSKKEAIEFEIRFVHQKVRFHYAIRLNIDRILCEELSMYPKGRKVLLFSRLWNDSSQTYHWGNGRIALGRITNLVKDNVLVLSAGFALNHPSIVDVYNIFVKSIVVSDHNGWSPAVTKKILTMGDENVYQAIVKTLRSADLGIDGLDILPAKEPIDVSSITGYLSEQRKKQDQPDDDTEIRLRHKGVGQKIYRLPWEYESSGTRKIFALSAPLASITQSDATWIVDELETGLHPLLTIELLKLFFSAENTEGAQIVFTTHSTVFLDANIMRRDQVYFVEKDDEGKSSLVPLSDYSPRHGESLGGGYLSGRYGAIPNLQF
ncbi:ATP-binding protein [Akkermansia glycaniphila]|uniref:AAA family ATPase n=1 Tax=Akkermansia glycaniphila TaxID=1679444 RepID=UPI001C009931|nr:ATP-binding protein [Akkermansia glycaniphila]MBT9448754.1 ATP-binding protein [Akkermansia glycaniphila]